MNYNFSPGTMVVTSCNFIFILSDFTKEHERWCNVFVVPQSFSDDLLTTFSPTFVTILSEKYITELVEFGSCQQKKTFKMASEQNNSEVVELKPGQILCWKYNNKCDDLFSYVLVLYKIMDDVNHWRLLHWNVVDNEINIRGEIEASARELARGWDLLIDV